MLFIETTTGIIHAIKFSKKPGDMKTICGHLLNKVYPKDSEWFFDFQVTCKKCKRKLGLK